MKALFKFGVLALTLSSALAQGSVRISFEEPPADTIIGSLNAYYAGLGITFGNEFAFVRGGLSAGDPGRWGLEGTLGPKFFGMNETDPQIRITFSIPIYSFTVDASRANGSKPVTVYSFSTYYKGQRTRFETFGTFGAINEWRTVSVTGGLFDEIRMTASGIEGGFAFNGNWGIDNLRFTQVPEPRTAFLFVMSLASAVAVVVTDTRSRKLVGRLQG